MSINSRIKERREELEMSRQELADKIGVIPSAIANYENGVSSPKIELLYKLFDVLE
jgi:transcriptional regulator with XRE-family HTH domain